jgi:hypothetical protein
VLDLAGLDHARVHQVLFGFAFWFCLCCNIVILLVVEGKDEQLVCVGLVGVLFCG